MIDYGLAYKIVFYPLSMTSFTIKIVHGIHNVQVFQEVSYDLLCQKQGRNYHLLVRGVKRYTALPFCKMPCGDVITPKKFSGSTQIHRHRVSSSTFKFHIFALQTSSVPCEIGSWEGESPPHIPP